MAEQSKSEQTNQIKAEQTKAEQTKAEHAYNNIPLLIFDLILLPFTLCRILLIYLWGAKYAVRGFRALDIVMHADTPYFNQDAETYDINTIRADIRTVIRDDSRIESEYTRAEPKAEHKIITKTEPIVDKTVVQNITLIKNNLAGLREMLKQYASDVGRSQVVQPTRVDSKSKSETAELDDTAIPRKAESRKAEPRKTNRLSDETDETETETQTETETGETESDNSAESDDTDGSGSGSDSDTGSETGSDESDQKIDPIEMLLQKARERNRIRNSVSNGANGANGANHTNHTNHANNANQIKRDIGSKNTTSDRLDSIMLNLESAFE